MCSGRCRFFVRLRPTLRRLAPVRFSHGRRLAIAVLEHRRPLHQGASDRVGAEGYTHARERATLSRPALQVGQLLDFLWGEPGTHGNGSSSSSLALLALTVMASRT